MVDESFEKHGKRRLGGVSGIADALDLFLQSGGIFITFITHGSFELLAELSDGDWRWSCSF
jgi:hypothetical protein